MSRTELIIAWTMIVLAPILVFLLWWFSPVHKHQQIPLSRPNVILQPVEQNDTVLANHHPLSHRPLYSVSALQELIANDPQLAQFYQTEGFDASCAQLESLPNNVWAFNSYRLNGQIHFTAKPVLIPRGTRVFIDCNGVIAKADCANILLTSRLPNPTDPQTEQALVPPVDTAVLDGTAEFTPTPANTQDVQVTNTTTIEPTPPIDTPPIVIPPSVPVAPTPEPPTWLLILLGCAGLLIFSRWTK